MHIIIAGESKLTYFLAKNFISKGYRVSIVMPDAKEAEYLARYTKAEVFVGDATEPEILRFADAYFCDLLVALTPSDEDNLVISLLASHELEFQKLLLWQTTQITLQYLKKLAAVPFRPHI
jgi:trk system potassium uptake protein TrkA